MSSDSFFGGLLTSQAEMIVELRKELDKRDELARRHLEYWQAMQHAPGCASETPNWNSVQAACNCPISRAIAELNEVMK